MSTKTSPLLTRQHRIEAETETETHVTHNSMRLEKIIGLWFGVRLYGTIFFQRP